MNCNRDTIQQRAETARQDLAACRLCPRDCGVNRLAGDTGYCGLGAEARCFRELLHPAEETPLNPSHQIYFSGCNLRCEFCSVLEWVQQPRAAAPMETPALLTAIARRRSQGAKTLNLLGGEPSVSLPGILNLLAQVPGDTTVVWNSNMYFRDRVLTALEGVVDLYLADLKCGNPTCAAQLLEAPDYLEVVLPCLVQAAGQTHMIIRHTPIPGHRDCCTAPILTWIADTLPDVSVSLRFDYIPPAEARHASLAYGDPEDRDKTLTLAHRLALDLIT